MQNKYKYMQNIGRCLETYQALWTAVKVWGQAESGEQLSPGALHPPPPLPPPTLHHGGTALVAVLILLQQAPGSTQGKEGGTAVTQALG